MNNWLWIVSVGVTDVQFPVWKTDNHGQWHGPQRFETGRGNVRRLHEGLLTLLERDQITFPDNLPEDIPRQEARDLRLEFEQVDDQFIATIRHDGYRLSRQGDMIFDNDRPPLPLYCPKVHPLLNKVQELLGNDPVSVLVLNTRRDETLRDGPNEPIAAGPLVAKFLAERLNLKWLNHDGSVPSTLERGKSTWVNILTGNETLEDRETQQRIIKRLTGLIRAWGAGPQARIVVTVTGGMPTLKPIFERVPAICIGQQNVKLLEQPERSRTAPAESLPLDYDARETEQLTLRFHCAEALRQGAYFSAYGLADKYREQPWAADVCNILGPLLNLPGNPIRLQRNGRSLFRFEIYALRVELCLHAADPVGAVLAMGSLLEATIWYLLGDNRKLKDAGLKVSPDTESVNGKWPKRVATKKMVAGLVDRDNNSARNQHKVRDILGNCLCWMNKYANNEQRTAVKKLSLLRNKYNKIKNRVSLRKCRNHIAHGAGRAISPDTISECFSKAGFHIGKNFGENFLAKSPVPELLQQLGSEDLKGFAKKELDKLLSKVIEG